MNSAQRYREFMTVPQIPGSEDFRTIQDFLSNRQFGNIRAGFPEQGIEQGIMGINVNPQITEEELIQRFLETEGGDVDIEDVARFQPQNVFQRGLGFLEENPAARVGLGALLGGPVGALFGLFSPKIREGVTSLIDRFKPAPNIPVRNIGDTDMSRGVTTSTGQSVSDSDLSSIGNTGFSEYSDPGTAASYEGSF